MSRGKRGTCNYKMMTFRISLKNLKYTEWKIRKNNTTKGKFINLLLETYREYDTEYHEQEEINPKQTTLNFE